jgi:S-(hydroxymethyl)glutathione dehydrogenase/alcohol dehydrogenase
LKTKGALIWEFELYKLGQLNLDDVVTREYTLEQINDSYRDMLEGRNIRGIIRFTDADRG